jgi:RNA polymerase sigma factor (TIGR02999 family)
LEQGNRSTLERLLPLVEGELRRIAKSHMRKVKKIASLQTTILVNDAYLKAVDQKRVHWKNRNHFFAIAATCMRRIVLDYIKAERRNKRGGKVEHIRLTDALAIPAEKSDELLALDDALQALERQDARKSQVVEMRYFGGYSVKEIAEFLEISETTVEREWRMARAWLQRELGAK